MKIAIVCDWLLGTGGAERVVLELHKLFPEAPIYTSQYDTNPKTWLGDKWFENADVRTGWLQKLPKSLKKFLPVLRAIYFSRLDLNDYDLVISSSGAEAKFVKVKQGAVHVSYCHAPTHYYWMRYEDYLKNPGFGKLDWLARIGLKILASPMRWADYRAAQRPSFFIANSNFTASKILEYYARDAIVIHPPVDIDRFKILNKSSISKHGYLAAGRQTPYKRIDLAVQACSQLDLPLTVVGNGPDHARLEKLAGPTVSFVVGASDKDVVKHFQSAKAFLFPGVDDFGVVAVEGLAAGTPVLAYKDGGALDYIEDKKNGLFFEEQTVESLISAINKVEKMKFDPSEVSASAAQFSAEQFRKKMKEFIKDLGVK